MGITIGEFIIVIIGLGLILYYIFQVYRENQRNKNICIEEENSKEEEIINE